MGAPGRSWKSWPSALTVPGYAAIANGASTEPGVRASVGTVAELVELNAQPDEILQRVHVYVPGHDRDDRRVAGDRGGGVAVQPRPAIPAALRARRPVRGPPGADPRSPFLLQGGAAIQDHQVREADVHPRFHGLSRAVGEQVAGGQSPHRFG